jgi:hypothetical protein
MRAFFRYLLVLGAVLLVTTLVIPKRYDVVYPKKLGPKLDQFVRKQYQEEIVQQKSDMVLIGDSVLLLSVDAAQLSSLIGKQAYSLAIPGSASAVWYLAMKNIVATSPRKPAQVVIVFRDTILTAPGYRVNGKYFSLVDELASPDDTVLVEKAFIQQMNPLEKWGDRFLPLYGSRLRLRETVDYYIRYTLPGLVGCSKQCNDDANIAVFQDLNLDANLLVEAIATAESYLYNPERLDFASQLPQSFLPEIVDLARKNNIQLILVRTKHLNDPSAATEDASLQAYITALKQYASKNNVIVLDFAHDDRLTSDLFTDSHHLSQRGAVVFTGMLAEALNPIVNP